MQRLIALIVISVFAVSLKSETIRLSEPTFKDTDIEVFGQMFDYEKSAITLHTIMQSPDDYLQQEQVVETTITKVCQKKGCFFIAQVSGQPIRISFKDYAYFIPTDTADKPVKMLARLVQKELSQEQAKHFTSDLKSDDVVLDQGKVYELIASGIMIPRHSAEVASD